MKKTPEDHELARSIGRIIAKRRTERELTQEEVAERLGVGLESVSRMERGVSLPNIAKLIRLAEVLACPVDELVTETSTRASDQGQVLATLLETLPAEDRRFVLEIIEKLSMHLKRARQ